MYKMDFIAHFFIGLLFYLLFLSPLNIIYFLIGCMCIDIDHIFVYLYRKRKGMLNEKEKKHWIKAIFIHKRPCTHSVWGATIFAFIVFIITNNQLYAYSLFSGIIVHLFLDSLDKEGVKWFWPWLHIKNNLPLVWIPKNRYFYKEPRFLVNSSIALLTLVIWYIK